MVLLCILKEININVKACHINYNNRLESIDEMKFLIKWCSYLNISLDVLNITEFNRNNTNRNLYEKKQKYLDIDFMKNY